MKADKTGEVELLRKNKDVSAYFGEHWDVKKHIKQKLRCSKGSWKLTRSMNAERQRKWRIEIWIKDWNKVPYMKSRLVSCLPSQ